MADIDVQDQCNKLTKKKALISEGFHYKRNR
ncbi:hypothetical protein BDD14_6516 [Edaphobacter modestus]|uniref:Uncharacterized protein n=1 Tax=Edaphobacter modestus TaxID=388466 RepID=A0A4Q7XYT2_9BACT|nr:hypothetical protein BDD14_6516 [Edaphobacter modestus]